MFTPKQLKEQQALVLDVLKAQGFPKPALEPSSLFFVEKNDRKVFFSTSLASISVRIWRDEVTTATYRISSPSNVSFSYSVGGNTIFGWIEKYFADFEDWKEALKSSLEMKVDLPIFERTRDLQVIRVIDEQRKLHELEAQIAKFKEEKDYYKNKRIGPVKKKRIRASPLVRPKAAGKSKK